MVVMVRAAAQPANPNVRVPMRDATAPAPKAPVLNVWDKAIHDAVAAAKPGPMEATVSAHVAAPIVQPVKLRNVAGVLRGTDPQLKDTYIIVTGHYDHLGMRPDMPGDDIYNGANDDASGTASVIAVAGALAIARGETEAHHRLRDGVRRRGRRTGRALVYRSPDLPDRQNRRGYQPGTIGPHG